MRLHPIASFDLSFNSGWHTQFHISFSSITLISGDALVIHEGKLMHSNPQHMYDVEQSLDSIKNLRHYDIENVICYHGGVMKDNVNERIVELSEWPTW